jgi:hypothetical protein
MVQGQRQEEEKVSPPGEGNHKKTPGKEGRQMKIEVDKKELEYIQRGMRCLKEHMEWIQKDVPFVYDRFAKEAKEIAALEKKLTK